MADHGQRQPIQLRQHAGISLGSPSMKTKTFSSPLEAEKSGSMTGRSSAMAGHGQRNRMAMTTADCGQTGGTTVLLTVLSHTGILSPGEQVAAAAANTCE
jgi:hypothetical protein